MKRVLSLVLALSMVLSMFSFAFASNLKDIDGTDYAASVDALIELGIVAGYPDGTFQPEKTVSRAEMAKLLVISAGLEKAADVAVGATKFSDVAGSHWASGYVNVASEYGYIVGYPDGTFQPDAQVTYAEAVTMALRALGYRTVIEAKGTWPTNYIAKATELKTLNEIEYDSYADGAKRGNVAKLVWNMLRTVMWDVTGENETNGLSYSNANEVTMIDKYFEDYVYTDADDEYVVTEIEVKDGKVTVTAQSDKVVNKVRLDDIEAELAEGTEFIDTFGRTVSILYNKKDEKIVMLTPSSDDKTVEGYKEDLEEDGYTLKGDSLVFGAKAEADDEYVKGVIDSKKETSAYTAFVTTDKNTAIVDEIKAGKKDATVVKAIDGTTWRTIDEDAIVLIDGEWANAKDLKANDVVTELVADELFIVSRTPVKGSFDEVTTEKDSDGVSYFLTVNGKKYENVLTDVVVEIDDDGDDKAETKLDDIQKDKDSKFYDETATLYVDFLGQVVRVEFEEVEDKENEGNFYVLTNKKASWTVTDKNGETVYVELNGESYEVKAGVSVDSLTDEEGSVVFVKFDSKDRVKEITIVRDGGTADDYAFTTVSGEGKDKEILDDNDYIGDYKVNDKTIVLTIKGIEDDDDEDVIDHYEVTRSTGTAALKGVESAIVAVDSGDVINGKTYKAAYVFVWEDAKNTDKTFGLVDKYSYTKGKTYLTIDSKSYELDTDAKLPVATAKDLYGMLVAFTENNGQIKIAKAYGVDELPAAAEVVDVDGRVFALADGSVIDLDRSGDDFEDYQVILATVTEDTEDESYDFTDWDEIAYKDIKLKKHDRIALTKPTDSVDVILIVRGYEAPETETPSGDDGDDDIALTGIAFAEGTSGEHLVGTNFTLTVVAEPDGATVPEVVWTVTGNENVTVTAAGKVTVSGDATGTATVTAKVSGDTMKADYLVTVSGD